MRLVGPIITALAAVFVWRNIRIWRVILLPVELPATYFAGGNAESQCRVVRDTVSHQVKLCEDAIFWDIPEKGGKAIDRRLLVTCDPSRFQWNTVMGPLRDPTSRGALWLYTPNSKTPLVNLELQGFPERADFHPLGLDVFPGSSPMDPFHLLIVNHGRDNTTIEQFRLSPVAPYQVTYVRTLTSPYFVSPNAVSFTSPSTFYVTQDHRFTRRLPGFIGKTLPLIETMILPGISWVNHVVIHPDGQLNVTYAARGISFANGIAVSGDKSKVAVASSSLGVVQLYSRTEDGKLNWEEMVQVPFSPDNVHFDDDILVAAGHPNFPALTAVGAKKTQKSPSWVVSIVPRTTPFNATATRTEDFNAPHPASHRAAISPSHEVVTLYQSNGSGFSSSSTGLWDEHSKTLFVTSLYGEGILTCQRSL